MRSRKRKGTYMVVVAVLCLLAIEACTFWMNQLFQPGDYLVQAFRLALTIPVIVCLYLGYAWAIWLFRIGFGAMVLSSGVLAISLDQANDARLSIVIPLAMALFAFLGLWVVTGSRGFQSHVRRQRQARGVYS